VNPVNLLPTKHRPRTPTGGQQGSAYVVVGVMAAVLVLVVFYVLTVNGINTRKSQVARAKAETAQAQARASSLSGYGDFSKIKAERVQSVKELAQGRIDWERLTRGLARVLPNDVWLLTASASASGNPVAGGGAAPSTPAPGDSSSTAATGPKVQLTGCAPGHNAVAVTLVRLRELSGATDVELNGITRPEPSSTTTPVGGAAGGGGSSDGSDCGVSHGTPNAKWDATVTFDQTAGAVTGPDKVPNSLGGGA
jgi:Tfp pilus assembly protein PilN